MIIRFQPIFPIVKPSLLNPNITNYQITNLIQSYFVESTN